MSGELSKKIETVLDEMFKGKYDYLVIDTHRPSILEDFTEIVDKARKEFPTVSAWNNPAIGQAVFIAEITDWFDKWFGEKP